MFRVEQHIVSRGKLHVPSESVKLSLAPVLPLLQQHPHLSRHAARKGRSGMAASGGGGQVLAGRRGERASGVLAAISPEGRIA